MQRMSELFNINTFIVSQVNPHICPFISSDGIIHEQSRLRRKISDKIKLIAGNEFRHWLKQLTSIGVIPEYIQGLADLVLQSYQGHVTISPRPKLIDYKGLVSDPTVDRFEEVLQHTYAFTIQRISHIRSLYGIEREFDRYYLRLKQKMGVEMNMRADKDLVKYQINKTLI